MRVRSVSQAVWALSACLLGAVAVTGAAPGIWAASAGNSDAVGGSKVWEYVTADVVPAASWGKAVEVPGTAALNKGGQAEINSISCGAIGNCSAGGSYDVGSNHNQAFVVSETHGTWGKAIEVPGTATLNKGGNASIYSVSCASAGNCSAGGSYHSEAGAQAFVVTERNGTWGKAIEVPGSGALNKDAYASLESVSCASAGNCSASGYYDDRGIAGPAHFLTNAFVVSERNGRWGKAIAVTGVADVKSSGAAAKADTISCASAGNCTAGGFYSGTAAQGESAFVLNEKHGTWGKSFEVPGLAALNTGRIAQIDSISCGAAGNCSGGGFYTGAEFSEQAFAVSEKDGTWREAIEVPGTATLNKGGNATVASVSCRSAGNCSAGGSYEDRLSNTQAFVVTEHNGTWSKAIEVPGTAALNKGGGATVNAVSCASAGNCSAGGSYTDSAGKSNAFVINQVNGTWGTAIEVPGTAELNKGGNATTDDVSCPSAGHCSAIGSYNAGKGHIQVFVDSEG